MDYRFEWDINKAKTNLSKHKISFENAISLYDEEHSLSEERWITIGIDTVTRTLVVIHTFVSQDNNSYYIRIISARKATKKEIKIYKER